MKEYLFSYGTLQRGDVQTKLFGRLLNGVQDNLVGYKLSSIEIKDECFLAAGEEKYQLTLMPSKDDSVQGVLFELTAEELLLADAYEPDNYQRIKVRFQSGREAWIFVAT